MLALAVYVVTIVAILLMFARIHLQEIWLVMFFLSLHSFSLSLSLSLSFSLSLFEWLLLRTSSSNPYFLFACDVDDVTLSPLSV